MAREIEIKLTIDPIHLDQISSHPLVERLSGGAREELQLLNTYYDTPVLDLHRHRMALRVRRDGDRFIQTLKTQGKSQNGLSLRNEWEWPLPDGALRLDRVPADLWPPDVIPKLHLIGPVFTTDFRRILHRITLPADHFGPGQPEARIDLALDRGRISVLPPHAAAVEAISEIEMELVCGEVETLRAFSLATTAGLPVCPSDISKAERGYRLVGGWTNDE